MTAPATEAYRRAQADRRAAIARGLASVTERIVAACERYGRSRDGITLVVVTKTFPASDIRHLAELGVHDVGENKVQEVTAKADDGAYVGLRLHFIGRLQSNKASLAGEHADVVHSLDRRKLIAPLAAGAGRAGSSLTALIQVSLDGDTGRGGVVAGDVPALADAVLGSRLKLGGVMGIAPLGADPMRSFARLADVAADLRRQAPGALIVSAGMSADLEAAIANGATHLRVGSAILGSRPALG